MAMDGFSAGLVLSAALKDNNSGADLYKEMMSDSDAGGPKASDRVWVLENIGKRVICGGSVAGTIVGINEATHGLYNGRRYPALVKVDKNGETYEYCLRTIELMDKE